MSRLTDFARRHKTALLRILAFALALLLWQVAAMAVGEQVLLASPLSVLGELFAILTASKSYAVIFTSAARILSGFFAGFLLAAVLAVLASRFPILETLLFPYMITIRSIPVASFIVVAWVFLDAKALSGFISFLIVLPVVYNNLQEGLHARDRALDEMASVYSIPFGRRLFYILRPQLRPTLLSATETSVGLSWKSGIAAEVIAMTSHTIGENIYNSKVWLDTPALFAWTVVIVLASLASEKLILLALRLLLGERRTSCKTSAS